MSRPKAKCDPCAVLDTHGLIPKAVKQAKTEIAEAS